MRAISNKAFGIKRVSITPALRGAIGGKRQVIPVDTSYLSDYTILAGISALVSDNQTWELSPGPQFPQNSVTAPYHGEGITVTAPYHGEPSQPVDA